MYVCVVCMCVCMCGMYVCMYDGMSVCMVLDGMSVCMFLNGMSVPYCSIRTSDVVAVSIEVIVEGHR